MKNPIFFPDREEFKEVLTETVESILDKHIPKIIRRANRKEFLTTSEFQELTGMSSRVQYYLRKRSQIAFSQQGRKIIYRTEDVEKFMDERRIEARDEE